MDPYRFDEWTKALVTARSRRGFLTGVLKAGAAALGFSIISAQTARADDDDDDDDDNKGGPTLAQCQRRLARCTERNSFQKCARCVNELAAAGCPFFDDPAADLTFVQATCSCGSDSFCADGNACTLDLCSSNVCYNVPIGNQLSDCTQCRRDRQCPGGGKCCNGRCCAPGSTCQTGPQGVGLCCETCETGHTCCQNIRIDGSPDSGRGYYLELGTCQGQEGEPFGLPTFCCGSGGGTGGYSTPSNPENPGLFCVLPVRGLP